MVFKGLPVSRCLRATPTLAVPITAPLPYAVCMRYAICHMVPGA